MKKIFVLAMALTMVLGFAGVSMASITTTEHWITPTSGDTGCQVCHTPHGATTSVTDAPLWGHAVTAENFTVYSSSTLDAGPLGQPDGISKLCLSCHDGVTAITGTTLMTGDKAIGLGTEGSLANDHPISFTYDATLATTDGDLWDPTSQPSGLGSTIDADLLFSHKLQCASCHDVHDNSNDPFLRMSNTESALCLTCHNKKRLRRKRNQTGSMQYNERKKGPPAPFYITIGQHPGGIGGLEGLKMQDIEAVSGAF